MRSGYNLAAPRGPGAHCRQPRWRPHLGGGRPTPAGRQGQVANPWSLNTLADGSLLMEFLNPLSAGRPPALGNRRIPTPRSMAGDQATARWFPVTPRPGGGSEHQVWLTSPATSPQTLWIVSASQQDTTYTVRQCVLQ